MRIKKERGRNLFCLARRKKGGGLKRGSLAPGNIASARKRGKNEGSGIDLLPAESYSSSLL